MIGLQEIERRYKLVNHLLDGAWEGGAGGLRSRKVHRRTWTRGSGENGDRPSGSHIHFVSLRLDSQQTGQYVPSAIPVYPWISDCLVLEGVGSAAVLHAYCAVVLPPPCQGSSFFGPPQGCVMSRLNIPDEDDDRYASNFHPGILSPARTPSASLDPGQRVRVDDANIRLIWLPHWRSKDTSTRLIPSHGTRCCSMGVNFF